MHPQKGLDSDTSWQEGPWQLPCFPPVFNEFTFDFAALLQYLQAPYLSTSCFKENLEL